MKRLLYSAALGLGVLGLAGCSQPREEPQPHPAYAAQKPVPISEEQKLQNDRKLVEWAARSERGHFADLKRAVSVATYRGLINDDKTYDGLVNAIRSWYPSLQTCAQDNPTTVRATSCQRSINDLQGLHFRMNEVRKENGKKVSKPDSVYYPPFYLDQGTRR